jgi:hypothetical protein
MVNTLRNLASFSSKITQIPFILNPQKNPYLLLAYLLCFSDLAPKLATRNPKRNPQTDPKKHPTILHPDIPSFHHPWRLAPPVSRQERAAELQHIVTAAQEASTAATEIEGEEFNPGLDKGGSFACWPWVI